MLPHMLLGATLHAPAVLLFLKGNRRSLEAEWLVVGTATQPVPAVLLTQERPTCSACGLQAIRSYMSKIKTSLDKLTQQQAQNILYYHILGTYPAPSKAFTNGRVIYTSLSMGGNMETIKSYVNA
jgi:hypothetical protein